MFLFPLKGLTFFEVLLNLFKEARTFVFLAYAAKGLMFFDWICSGVPCTPERSKLSFAFGVMLWSPPLVCRSGSGGDLIGRWWVEAAKSAISWSFLFLAGGSFTLSPSVVFLLVGLVMKFAGGGLEAGLI